MDCSQFEELFHDLDRPGTDGFAARQSVLEHAESCSRCAQLLTQAESLDLAFSALSAWETAERAPARVENLLREEFRMAHAGSARRRVRWQIAALATAATVLLALGFSIRHYQRLSAGNGVGSYSTPAPGHEIGPKQGDANSAGASSGASDVAAADSQSADSDSASAFIPLPYADDSMSTDGGAIVRVVLSRPELASLGLPVTDMADTDRIPADIIVSEDGAPQAIRLVSQPALD